MKLAIICTGGGMRCAYSGGALTALAKEFKITNPDIVIGISGGAGSLVYYLTKQYNAIEHIWTDLLTNTAFISVRPNKPILDIDYLIDTIFKTQKPLDIAQFKSTITDWYFPATDADKHMKFFSKDDNLDIFEILRATMAVPIVYGKRIVLGTHSYRDGDFGLTVDNAIEKACSLGATHIIVIESELENFRVRFIDRLCKSIIPQNKVATNAPMPHIIRIQNTHSSVGPFTNNKKKLRSTFDAGYSAIKNNLSLKKFLSSKN